MKNFVILYYAPISAVEQMSNASPEEMEEGMKAWMAWARDCGDGLVDLGTPLAGGQSVTQAGGSPSERGVCGYSVLRAETIEDAKTMLDGHPHLGWDAACEIEIHESMSLPSA